MALVTTVSEVIGVLVAVAVLLWFSSYIEARKLGPVAGRTGDPAPVPAVSADGPAVVSDAMSPAA